MLQEKGGQRERTKVGEGRRHVSTRPTRLHLDVGVLVELDALRALLRKERHLVRVRLLSSEAGRSLLGLARPERLRLALLKVLILGPVTRRLSRLLLAPLRLVAVLATERCARGADATPAATALHGNSHVHFRVKSVCVPAPPVSFYP
jgi:hypothetical protein